jgi:hypothetical protein
MEMLSGAVGELGRRPFDEMCPRNTSGSQAIYDK